MKAIVISTLCLAGTLVAGFAADVPEKTRLFITDSHSWEASGGIVGADGAIIGSSSGGARPQTAEIIKTFRERCPEFTVTLKEEKADYIVVLDHEGGKGFFRRDNKVVVFNREGDAIFSNSTVILGNAVQDACNAIIEDTRP